MTETKEILLSISILMSGRKETRQCLESLIPIMDAIPCELILVDTGCGDETREILKEYTDNIITFEWCNDFAKARNVGLQRAKGKWFMFLDDDEWFVDTSEIIEFFKKGEYKNYKAGAYIVRNYSDFEEKSYSDARLTRMTQIFDNTKFESPIHEYLRPLYKPVKNFNTYVKHFGYVYKTRKDLLSDSKRNLSLLKEEFRKNPDDLRLAGLMLQEYRRIGEFDSILDLSKKCIKKSWKDKYKNTKIDDKLGSFYGYILDAYESKYEYEECLKYIEKIKEDKRINDVTKAVVYKSETISSYNIGDYKRSKEAFENYMKIYNDIADDKDKLLEQQFVLTYGIFQDNMLKNSLFTGLMSEMKLGKEDNLKKYFDLLDWDESEKYVHDDFINVFMDYILSKDNCEEYVDYINKVIERKSCLYKVSNYIEKLEDKINRIQNIDDEMENQDNKGKSLDINEGIEELNEKFDKAIRLMCRVENGYWYFIYLKVLNYKNNSDKERCIYNIKNLFNCVVDKFNLDNKLWDIVAEVGIKFDSVVCNTDFDSWKLGIDRWLKFASIENIENKEKLLDNWKGTLDYRYDYFKTKVLEGKLLCYCKKDEIVFEKLEKSLNEFVHATFDYCTKIYNVNVIESHNEVLPKECVLAIKLLDVEDYRNKNNYTAVIDTVKECINIYEPFNCVLKIYLQKYGEFIERDDDCNTDDVSQELAQITASLKLKVREFIENGNIVEARVVLNQIIQCVPEDKEAKEILNLISE